MEIGEWIVIGIAILFGGWFIVGNNLNERRNQEIFRWLRKACQSFGTLGAVRRFDPSSIGMKLVDTTRQSPFTQLEVSLNLVRRENLPLWLYQKLRNKRDSLIIKANIKDLPHSEVHALAREDQGVLEVLNRGEIRALSQVEKIDGYLVYARGTVDEHTLQSLKEKVLNEPSVTRLSLQPKAPHLTVHADLENLLPKDGEAFFTKIAS